MNSLRMRTYKMRSTTVNGGKTSVVDVNMEFEGTRAFVIWESVPLGHYQLQARLEIDPRLLQRVQHHGCDYLYHGELILPRPEDN